MHGLPRPPLAPRQIGDKAHVSRMEPSEVDAVFPDQLYKDIILASRFQRLKQIRFLGAIDYIVSPNGQRLHVRHTRYDHSLGVGLLAKKFAELLELSKVAERTLVSAALLHDIGHAPLSHSLEPVFREHFGVDHHIATVEIIKDGFKREEPLAKILASHGVDAEAVISLIGSPAGECASLFVGKFNIDTLDAIPRCSTYLLRNPSNAAPFDVLRAAYFGGPNNLKVLDAFWSLKNLVYKNLIQSPTGIMADRNAQDFLRANIAKFSRSSFFSSEPELRRTNPKLFTSLDRPRWDRAPVNKRNFEIVAAEDSVDSRYVERREPGAIDFLFRSNNLDLQQPTEARLFSDER
jgi:uncharacterized protein